MNLTKPQEAIWDMERFSGGSVSVICTSMLRKGKQNISMLQNTVNKLFFYNDALRIRLHMENSDVTQYFAEYTEQYFDVLDFSSQDDFNKYAEKYSHTPIDLSGPLCDIKIIILPEKYGLLVKIHHIIADAWTMALLASQFNRIIDGLAPQCFSYKNYLEKEAEYSGSQRYLKDKQFFLDLVEKQDEPVFIRNETLGSFLSKRKSFIIEKEKASKIRDFCNNKNCSVFSVFAAALAAYLCRINYDKESFFIGTNVLNRTNLQEMNTAGMFVNTVPLLLSAKPIASFAENLEIFEDMLLSVFKHQRYNYKELLTEALEGKQRFGRLFDVTLNYMNAVIEGVVPETENTWFHNGMQNESLQIHIDDRNGEGIFRISYDYQTAKFSADEIVRFHTHIMNLLFDGIEHPEKTFCKLTMLSQKEEQQLLFDFNDTVKSYAIPHGSTIYSLFEETSKKDPSKTCITVGNDSISYHEFKCLSEKIDKILRTYTQNKKSVVAVIAERSIPMYAALYGIVRGGNAYLPISPDLPPDRIRYMLKDSNASCVIVQREFIGLAEGVPCVDLSEFDEIRTEEDEVPPCSAEENDTAYVIYTSGSTGTPKGVKISHKSAINRILWMNDAYPLYSDDVILQKTPYTFDVSVWEIFWWGMCGGSMVASNPGEHFLPSKILETVSYHKVTHLHFVPSVFEVFLAYLEKNKEEQKKLQTVKHVFVSGEVLDISLVKRFYSLYDYNQVQLHNLYGPTECAVDVTCYDCLPTDSLVPIGKPIYNTQIYITDKYLNLVPTEIKGELIIGGKNVGQGYVNNPNLTKERFIDNPFGEGKLYRTGDIAYRRKEGQIIFCGRIDEQIKLNGQRLEIGEIEAVVKSVPGVESVAVILRKTNGRDVLAAFYCGNKDLGNEIMEMLRNKLPGYMIPKLLFKVEHIPLNQNGKCNRKILEDYEIELSSQDFTDFPKNEAESLLCEKFKNVLGLEHVGRNSDFFDLGGTSLSMITFFAENDYDNITPAEFIKNATPAKLAVLLKNKENRQTLFLEELYKSPVCKEAYVLFPFAGGNAESYTALTNFLKKQNENASIYFVPFLHSDEECEKAADEIIRFLGKYNVYFYSHCAGSAVALKILHVLEKKQQHFVKHYFAAASVPAYTNGSKNIWNYVPDSVLKYILKKAGAQDKFFTDKILRKFRKDTDYTVKVFSDMQKTYNYPVSLIIGKKDLFTKFYLRPEKKWKRYVQIIENIYSIDTADHYFQSSECEILAKIICRKQNRDNK